MRSSIGTIALLLLSSVCGGSDPPNVTLDFYPLPSVAVNQTATLYWWAGSNATSCTAMGRKWGGPQPTNGNFSLSLSTPGTYVYTFSCSLSLGAAVSASATLLVTPVLSAPTAAELTGKTTCAADPWVDARAQEQDPTTLFYRGRIWGHIRCEEGTPLASHYVEYNVCADGRWDPTGASVTYTVLWDSHYDMQPQAAHFAWASCFNVVENAL